MGGVDEAMVVVVVAEDKELRVVVNGELVTDGWL